MARPRISSADSRAPISKRSRPSNRIAVPVTRALGGSAPRMVRARVVLPQPDSPTRPMISPRRKARLTASSTCAVPPSVEYVTETSRTDSRSTSIGTSRELRVQSVPQPVAQQIETDDDQQDRDARRGRVPPGVRQILAAFGDHAAPLGCWRRRPEAQETERGRDQN